MLKKIGTFLMISLAISSVLLLMATGSRQPYKTPDTVETTVPTTAPTTVPETQSEAQTEQVPQTTTPAETAPSSGVRGQVERILERAELAQTNVTRRVTGSGLGASEQTAGLAGGSHATALAELAESWKMNPVAAFWELVSAGLYEKQTDESGVLEVAAFQPPAQEARQYEYTDEGTRKLLTELLTLAARMEDGLDLELALLGANTAVEADQVFYSDAEQCRYAYFCCDSDRVTYILCCYLRGAERIDDVEFQLLYLRHASGGDGELAQLDETAKKQAASLMAAAELLMTGKTKAGEGQIPFGYEVGGAKAALEWFEFTGDPDRGSLVNYRLRMK